MQTFQIIRENNVDITRIILGLGEGNQVMLSQKYSKRFKNGLKIYFELKILKLCVCSVCLSAVCMWCVYMV